MTEQDPASCRFRFRNAKPPRTVIQAKRGKPNERALIADRQRGRVLDVTWTAVVRLPMIRDTLWASGGAAFIDHLPYNDKMAVTKYPIGRPPVNARRRGLDEL